MAVPVAILALAEALATASASGIPQLASKNSRFLGPVLMRMQRAAKVGGGTVYGAKLNGRSNANRNDFQGDGSTTVFDTNIAYAALSHNNWIVRIGRSTRSGTVAVTAASKTVTGTSTAFTTELAVGKEILVNGEKKTVMIITDDTHLTVDSNFAATASGKNIDLWDDILVPTTDFTVSNNGGNARITIGAASKAPNGIDFSVHFVTADPLYTFVDGAKQFDEKELPGGYNVYWYEADSTSTPSATNVYLEPIGQ